MKLKVADHPVFLLFDFASFVTKKEENKTNLLVCITHNVDDKRSVITMMGNNNMVNYLSFFLI